MASKDELIQMLKESHQHIENLIAQIEPNQVIYPEWTIREILAHFTGWDDAVLASLKSHAAGDVPTVVAPRGADVYNKATITERETLSFEHVYREWQATHEQLKIAIRDLPPEKMEAAIVFPWGEHGNIEDLVIGLTKEHESSHIKDIEAVIHKGN